MSGKTQQHQQNIRKHINTKILFVNLMISFYLKGQKLVVHFHKRQLIHLSLVIFRNEKEKKKKKTQRMQRKMHARIVLSKNSSYLLIFKTFSFFFLLFCNTFMHIANGKLFRT